MDWKKYIGVREFASLPPSEFSVLVLADLLLALSWMSILLKFHRQKCSNGMSKKTFGMLFLSLFIRYLDIFVDLPSANRANFQLKHIISRQSVGALVEQLATQRLFYVYLMKWFFLSVSLAVAINLTFLLEHNLTKPHWQLYDRFQVFVVVIVPWLLLTALIVYLGLPASPLFKLVRHSSFVLEGLAVLPQISLGTSRDPYLHAWLTLRSLASCLFVGYWFHNHFTSGEESKLSHPQPLASHVTLHWIVAVNALPYTMHALLSRC
eukprot:c7743_g1_i1.p1 GENE.c7743_g1_i1~~c7743_g1_i1.p1  ORF type:complete len:276 (-),score=73.34 c7743_g1_i1:661-1455(-)